MSRKPFDYLIWHCTATRETRPVTRQHLEEWHLGPRNVNGGVKYMGDLYETRDELPDHHLNGKHIRDINGRGWSRLGYAAMFHLDGSVEVLREWNQDEWIDSDEITNGAKGMNSRSRHFVYVGGTDLRKGKPKDTRNPAQDLAMEIYTQSQIDLNPDLLVAGHNAFSNKACPSFSVREWMTERGFPESNIYDESKK